jgi:hypothetical protein
MKAVFQIDPLTDPRWPEFLQRQPLASIFHSSEWLAALHTTYGYLPLAYTTSPPHEALANGWVFCEVRSWLTGRRLVSLPFSDHCDPLADDFADLAIIGQHADQQREQQHWDYLEFRPHSPSLENIPRFQLHQACYVHTLDLRPSLEQIFAKLAKDSIQRKIRRAERDALTYEEGRTKIIADIFYILMCRTRRRHGIPPQPRKWFYNLLSSLGNRAMIRMCTKDGKPVGALLTISYKNILVYKYSCGEPEFFKHGAMQWLLWRAIEDAKSHGAEQLDFGRTDFGDAGLMLYKERWGAIRSEVGYFRCYPIGYRARRRLFDTAGSKLDLSSFIPQGVLAAAGRLLYRHFG